MAFHLLFLDAFFPSFPTVSEFREPFSCKPALIDVISEVPLCSMGLAINEMSKNLSSWKTCHPKYTVSYCKHGIPIIVLKMQFAKPHNKLF